MKMSKPFELVELGGRVARVYTSRPQEVFAIQFDGLNTREVMDFIFPGLYEDEEEFPKENMLFCMHDISADVPQMDAQVGDFIVDDEGKFHVMPSEEFLARYEA